MSFLALSPALHAEDVFRRLAEAQAEAAAADRNTRDPAAEGIRIPEAASWQHATTTPPPADISPLEVEEVAPPLAIPRTLDLTAPTDDLWQRIRNGFAMPNLNNDEVLHFQQYYQSHPDYLRRIVERSRLYLHHIVEELEKRHMPTELALLPMVESAYNPMALSSSQASGLWQFIPSTGRHYKLQQDWWRDERRDIVASTEAALDYLQYIYELQGDWHLTLASYNWGEGAVGRAVAKNEKQERPTDYGNLALPNETRQYVPKLQALKNIFSNPALMTELGIPPIPNQPYFHTLVSASPIDVALAARFAGLSVREFLALNPAHNRPVIPANTTLVIPADRVEAFQAALEAHPGPLSSWQTYTLRPREKLEDVAPRFGIALSQLKQVNGLTGRRLKILPGQILLVPRQDTGVDLDDVRVAATLSSSDSGGSGLSLRHRVQKGDTLAAIGRRYQVRVADLKRWNRLDRDTIRAGMTLIVHPGEPARSHRNVSLDASKPKGLQSPPRLLARAGKVKTHAVKKGDTLYSIARQYKVAIADLRRWNPSLGRVLKIGAQLRIQ